MPTLLMEKEIVSMRVYKLSAQRNDYLDLCTEGDFEVSSAFYDLFYSCNSHKADWKSRELVWDIDPTDRSSERRKIPDYTCASIAPVFFARAKTIMEPLLNDQVEFLPVETPLGEAWAINTSDLLTHWTSRFANFVIAG